MKWIIWALFLLAQNYSFTYVSRARNSGLLSKHIKGAIFSNLIYIINISYMFQLAKFLDGQYGHLAQVGICVFYTVFTVCGSISAHFIALKTEQGLGAVGANKRFAQIPIEEWEKVKTAVLPA